VPGDRVFLTHGASEANALALFYLARTIRSEQPRAPTVRIPRPEYPPLFDAAALAGFHETPGSSDLFVRTEPNNPTGRSVPEAALDEMSGGAPRWLIDETFREFTPARSCLRTGRRGLWATGTLTKAYGGDSLRVGWVVPSEEDLPGFRPFHGVLTDQIAWLSAALALDLLTHADEILAESRALFQANLAILRRALPEIEDLSAPVAFDHPGVPDTEPLARAALSQGILTSPGHFFGEPSGIRIGLTRRSFAKDLPAYLKVRSEFVR
jgi:aspartate/methionine/tyrosine aminotransferase